MKVYLIKRKQTNIRWFDNDVELTQFLTSEKNKGEKISEYSVITVDATTESETTGDNILTQISEQIELDTKLNVVLGDEYAQNVQKFIELFNELATDVPSKKQLLTILNSTPATKAEFSKVVKKHQRYFLYNVSPTVEWYVAVLNVCTFKKLTDTCEREYFDPVTRGSRWMGGRTPKNMLENFDKAKLLV